MAEPVLGASSGPGVRWPPLPGAAASWCPQGGERALIVKALAYHKYPTLKTLSKAKSLPQDPLLIPSCWGLGLQHRNLGGGHNIQSMTKFVVLALDPTGCVTDVWSLFLTHCGGMHGLPAFESLEND